MLLTPSRSLMAFGFLTSAALHAQPSSPPPYVRPEGLQAVSRHVGFILGDKAGRTAEAAVENVTTAMAGSYPDRNRLGGAIRAAYQAAP